MKNEKKCRILIPEDSQNKGKQQFEIFQLDGETVQVPLNVYAEVPLWVGKRAVEIGLIPAYIEI